MRERSLPNNFNYKNSYVRRYLLLQINDIALLNRVKTLKLIQQMHSIV